MVRPSKLTNIPTKTVKSGSSFLNPPTIKQKNEVRTTQMANRKKYFSLLCTPTLSLLHFGQCIISIAYGSTEATKNPFNIDKKTNELLNQ